MIHCGKWNFAYYTIKNESTHVCSFFNSLYLYLNPSKINQCRINWIGDAAGSITVIPFYFYLQSLCIKLTILLRPLIIPLRNLPTRQSFSDHGTVWIYCQETPTFTTRMKACRNTQYFSTNFWALFSIFLHFLYTSQNLQKFFGGLEGDFLIEKNVIKKILIKILGN